VKLFTSTQLVFCMDGHNAATRGPIKTLLPEAGSISAFAMRAVRVTFQAPFELGEVVRQVYMVGWRSLPLVVTSGLAIGVVLSMHTRPTIERFGAELIPAALAIALISETGPLLTGLLVSGRVGAGIGAELGGMKVTEQIDALESLAVDSFHYLAVTRIIACMVALPIFLLQRRGICDDQENAAKPP
jgi:phospholipid/cholesterol/gamma-HCH transport system permease protein